MPQIIDTQVGDHGAEPNGEDFVAMYTIRINGKPSREAGPDPVDEDTMKIAVCDILIRVAIGLPIYAAQARNGNYHFAVPDNGTVIDVEKVA